MDINDLYNNDNIDILVEWINENTDNINLPDKYGHTLLSVCT